MNVSVVISVKNAQRTIAACCRSLQMQKTNLTYEIIFVDNGSDDRTCQQIQICTREQGMGRILLLHESTPGSAACRNTGVRASSGEIIVFSDADCEFAEDWLEKIIAPFSNRDVHAVGGQTLSRWHPKMNRWEMYADKLFYFFEKDRMATFPAFLPWSPSCNYAVRSNVFSAIGFFEESWAVAYDVDFCWRMCLGGFQLHYQPEAIVYHWRRNSWQSLRKQISRYSFYNIQLLNAYQNAFNYFGISKNWKTLTNRSKSFFLKLQYFYSNSSNAIEFFFGSLLWLSCLVARLQGGINRNSCNSGIQRASAAIMKHSPFLPQKAIQQLLKMSWVYWPNYENEEEIILFHLSQRKWIRLNQVAWFIWLHHEEKNDKICALLRSEFEIDPTTPIHKDIQSTFAMFYENNLLPTAN